MKKTCHACGEQISENAEICPACMSHQNKFLFYANGIIGIGTLFISGLSLVVSFVALYFSQVVAPASPMVEVQINRFEDERFSFFVSNTGNLPTSISDFDLSVNLVRGDGTHRAKAGFSIPPIQLEPGESQFLELEYSSFVPRHTRWTTSGDLNEPFTLNFFYGAAALGNNLHCQVDVYYTSRRYFPSNLEGSIGAVNGACSSAMKWYAEHVGPLSADVTSE
ncbi:hypothetical protein [Thioclava sp. SK-1]|uniref:hypothetical protein n=1 Tax=Thioclava sp. SK-1 TaxID=1889770 RepID=UPI0008255032|nr:hypothetical protein [Thioclava sp. SK-1]